MTTSTKPLALVFGATGKTGRLITSALLRSDAFRVSIATRSSTSETAAAFRQQGADIRVVDLTTQSSEQLTEALRGVDFVVSTLSADVLQAQRPLFAAAKAAGVKRVIPSDFGPSTPHGVTIMNDEKLAIRDYIRTLGVPYTFVEIGWWLQLAFPYPPGSFEDSLFAQLFNNVYGDGEKKNALTDMSRVGDLVARILLDERAVNQTIFYHETEMTQTEAWEVAQRVSGLGESLLAKQVRVPVKALESQLAQVREEHDKLLEHEKTFAAGMKLATVEYVLSMYIRGDNTLENAKRLGKLDGKELYPDLEVTNAEEYATAFYKNPIPPLY